MNFDTIHSQEEASFIENTTLQEDLEDLVLKYGLQTLSCTYVEANNKVKVCNIGKDDLVLRLKSFIINYWNRK